MKIADMFFVMVYVFIAIYFMLGGLGYFVFYVNDPWLCWFAVATCLVCAFGTISRSKQAAKIAKITDRVKER